MTGEELTMHITSDSFEHGHPIPDVCAFAKKHPLEHVTFSANRNPHLAWDGVPGDTRSFAIICVDPDAPTVPDDVNKVGHTVAADLPRGDFHHWVMVDVPATVRAIAEGACSDGVTKKGKQDPTGPAGSRQGVNDYTGWFASDPDMSGTYLGYDGCGPPWNDERVHRYHFTVYALDVDRCDVSGAFTATDVKEAIAGHVLAEATITGTYTLNPEL